MLSGVAAFAALALEADPWHDVSLVVMFAAWTAIGVTLLRTGEDALSRHPVRASTRVRERTSPSAS